MGKHRHDLRELGPEESGEPTEAWIEYANGTRLDLALERTAKNEWVARPPHPVVVGPGDHLRLDRLGPGMGVEFVDVMAPDAEATHQG